MMLQCRTRIPLLLVPFIACVLFPVQAARSAPAEPAASKAYSPFDEPRPRIPQEILDDKRLDQKVKVFVKSKNMKQLFADLSARTGVRITASRKLRGERPIVYFHKRPLRDVMTEVSGLYGYRWLISGKPAAYEYELFEDIRHAARRDELLRRIKKERESLVVEFTNKAGSDPGVLEHVARSEEETGLPPPSPRSYASVAALLRSLGPDTLKKAFAEHGLALTYADMPTEAQAAALAWLNARDEERRRMYEEEGLSPPRSRTLTGEDLRTARLSLEMMDGEGVDVPGFLVDMKIGDSPPAAWSAWPPSGADEDDIRKAMGEPAREMLVCEKPLPETAKITVNKPRWTDFDDSYVLIGDVLEAIAGRTGLDVIADYYLQGYNCLDPFEKQDLRAVLCTLRDKCDYACNFDGSLLRLRYYPWFSRRIGNEPPAALVDKCWRELAEKGDLEIETMVEIAGLPDEQFEWEGFLFIPCADWALVSREDLRLWGALGPELISEAKRESGLPVSSLTQTQLNELELWVKSAAEDPKPEAVADGTMRIEYVSDPSADAWKKYFDLELQLPGRAAVTGIIRLDSMYDEKALKQVIAQRKADAEADVIELAP